MNAPIRKDAPATWVVSFEEGWPLSRLEPIEIPTKARAADDILKVLHRVAVAELDDKGIDIEFSLTGRPGYIFTSRDAVAAVFSLTRKEA